MKSKIIQKIYPLGFQWTPRDPFLFCVHHEDYFPSGEKNATIAKKHLKGRDVGSDFQVKNGFRMYHGSKTPGFPAHPHRGFETVTVVQKGFADHADSFGGHGRYGQGDTQWMTAGKGVQHSEMFPLLNQDQANPLELFQIWLNLPARSKFVKPHYKMMWKEDKPIIEQDDSHGISTKIEIISGTLNEKTAQSSPPDSWAHQKENCVSIWVIKIPKGGIWTLPKSIARLNRSLYFFKGDQFSLINNEQNLNQIVKAYHGIDLYSDQALSLSNTGIETAQFLFLEGRPINEPVVQHGPFVMNTHEEIQKAFSDFRRTGFNGWPWDDSGPIHPLNQERFATQPNGKTESPPEKSW
jgi:quercetin 2,3-dioxygenase